MKLTVFCSSLLIFFLKFLFFFLFAINLERGFVSSSLASTLRDAAEDAEAVETDQMEMEAAEILATLAHSKKRNAVSIASEFAAKWGCKGKRVRKRVSCSESPPSEIGLNPVQSGSVLAEVGFNW